MATTYIQGRNFIVYNGTTPIGCAKTLTAELATATSDATTNCDVASDGTLWARNVPQKNSFKITVNGLMPVQNSVQMLTQQTGLALMKLQAAQTLLYITFQNPQSGGLWMGGNAYITSSKVSAQTEQEATFDVTFDGDGKLDFLPVS